MTDSVVAEGQVKLRDGKKWKNRWLVLRKPSPVADCLLMLMFKDKSEKNKGHKERSSVTLEDICGLEPGLSLEGVNHVLAIICLAQTALLAFENKETMCAWDIRTRYSLGEVHRFQVNVLPGTKLESGPAILHFCNNIFVLVRDVPPAIIGHWKLSDMRRYGAIPNGFVFEGGSRCGIWAGVFFLSCAEGERISFLFDCTVRGISPSKGPFGLRPVLPDPNTSLASIEERISHEALELEKRLSLLSQSSRHSSGGDDRSLSSSTESSDTSQSDSTSIGSRLTLWPEHLAAVSSPQEAQLILPAGRPQGPSEEKTTMEASRGIRPLPKPPRPRKLQEVGRQSSSDSGIATASHSSYSGSFSSYAGSLDTCQSDEFGSQASLPWVRTADRAWCTCEGLRSPGSEYRVPSAIHHHYDTPRSILMAASGATQVPGGQEWAESRTAGMEKAASLPPASDTTAGELQADLTPRWPWFMTPGPEEEESRGGDGSASTETMLGVAGSTGPCEGCGPYLWGGQPLITACPACGGLKGTTDSPLASSSILGASGSGTGLRARPGRVYLARLLKTLGIERKEPRRSASQTTVKGGKIWQSILGDRYGIVWDLGVRRDTGGCRVGNRQPTAAKGSGAKIHSLKRSCSAEEALGRVPRAGGTGSAFLQRLSSPATYETMVTAWRPKPGPGLAAWRLREDAYKVIAAPGRLLAAAEKVRTFPGTRPSAGLSANSIGSEPYLFLQAPAAMPWGREPGRGDWGREVKDVKCSAPHASFSGRLHHEENRQGRLLLNSSTAVQELTECNATSREGEPNEYSNVIADKKTVKKEEKKVVTGQMYELMESLPMEKQSEAEKGNGYEYMASCGPPKPLQETEGPPGASKSHRRQGSLQEVVSGKQKREKGLPEDETSGSFETKKFSGGPFACPQDLPGADRSRGEGATYVNIPVSPVSKKQLHYMELELQESSAAVRVGASSSKYAQIDITATETAHKVGSQHAQHREERLQELEQKRKGPPLQ